MDATWFSVGIGLLALLVSGPVAWIVRSMISDIKSLNHDLATHRTHVAETYVRQDDLHRELADIKRSLDKLFDLLRNMSTKPHGDH